MCKKGALCWKCSNATGGCNWSKSLLPVDGWETEETVVDGKPTHKVISCPEFERDSKKKVAVEDIAHLADITFRTLNKHMNTEQNFERLNRLLFDDHYLLIEKLKNVTPHLKF